MPDLLAWCEDSLVLSRAAVQPLHVAPWAELHGSSMPRRPSSSASLPSGILAIGW
jgi:hypothetical protein